MKVTQTLLAAASVAVAFGYSGAALARSSDYARSREAYTNHRIYCREKPSRCFGPHHYGAWHRHHRYYGHGYGPYRPRHYYRDY